MTRPITDLCLAAEKRPWSRMANWWRKQYILDLERIRTAAWEAELTEEEEDTDGTETETDMD